MKRAILDLRPTQMAIGMKEVDFRLEKIRSLKKAELDDYLHERRTPVVLGPKSRTYCVDHHHLLRACWEAGIEEVPVEIKADMSSLSFSDFWKCLHDSHWIFPFDQFGNGPHDPLQLPETIRCLADDPFRSLAWLVRENGGYQKAGIPFVEFQWANFFRKQLKLHPVYNELDGALKEALQLSQSPAAGHLPGYIGKNKAKSA